MFVHVTIAKIHLCDDACVCSCYGRRCSGQGSSNMVRLHGMLTGRAAPELATVLLLFPPFFLLSKLTAFYNCIRCSLLAPISSGFSDSSSYKCSSSLLQPVVGGRAWRRTATIGKTFALQMGEFQLLDADKQAESSLRSLSLFRLERQATWGSNQALLFEVFVGPFQLENGDGVSVVVPSGTVRVEAWQTIAEVIESNASSWLLQGTLRQASTNADWLRTFTGSRDGLIVARFSQHGRDVWTLGHCITGSTVIGELWRDAECINARNTERYGGTEMTVTLLVEDGTARDVVLQANSLVIATRLQAAGWQWTETKLVFSDIALSDELCWGEVWQTNGMVDHCTVVMQPVDLGRAGGDAWTPTSHDRVQAAAGELEDCDLEEVLNDTTLRMEAQV